MLKLLPKTRLNLHAVLALYILVAAQIPIAAEELRAGDEIYGERIDNEPDAVSAARVLLGIVSDDAELNVAAGRTSLPGDRTPFLHRDISNKPLWRVVVQCPQTGNHSWLCTEPIRTMEAYFFEDSGRLAKVVCKRTQNGERIGREAEPWKSEEDIQRGGNEMYHGIPDVAPPISFLEALEVVMSGSSKLSQAKEIEGLWVMWSMMNSDPKPMWVIDFRGIPPISRKHQIHLRKPLQVNHRRYVVDPVRRKWVFGGSSPHPVPK